MKFLLSIQVMLILMMVLLTLSSACNDTAVNYAITLDPNVKCSVIDSDSHYAVCAASNGQEWWCTTTGGPICRILGTRVTPTVEAPLTPKAGPL